MNTSRILDIVPASATPSGPSPAAAAAQERAAQAVAPVAANPEGGSGGVSDAVRQRVAAEAKRQTDRRTLADQVHASRNMTSRVGYFDGSTMVFVDLLDARTQRALLRVFGPSQPPATEPAQASEAYEAALRLPGAGEAVSL
jgi:hypothetical protein